MKYSNKLPAIAKVTEELAKTIWVPPWYKPNWKGVLKKLKAYKNKRDEKERKNY